MIVPCLLAISILLFSMPSVSTSAGMVLFGLLYGCMSGSCTYALMPIFLWGDSSTEDLHRLSLNRFIFNSYYHFTIEQRFYLPWVSVLQIII